MSVQLTPADEYGLLMEAGQELLAEREELEWELGEGSDGLTNHELIEAQYEYARVNEELAQNAARMDELEELI